VLAHKRTRFYHHTCGNCRVTVVVGAALVGNECNMIKAVTLPELEFFLTAKYRQERLKTVRTVIPDGQPSPKDGHEQLDRNK